MNLKAIAAAGALALLAGSAHAATSITYYDYGIGAPALTLLDNFSTDTVGSAPASTSAYTWTGGQIFKGTGTTNAAPATGFSTQDTGNYLATLVGTTTTLTLAKPLSQIEIYIGSLDSYNTISFSNGDSFTGAQLQADAAGAVDSSNQQLGSSNGMFDFKFTTAISSVTFADNTANAFEVASISASAVPEPATWAMMLTGLFGLGMAMRVARRGKTARSVAA